MANKTIALFGATGKTGQEFLIKALDAGYKIQALVRSPAKLSQQHANLTVIQGDVLNAEQVRQAVSGSQSVVSLFGHVKGSPPRVQTEGTENIVRAMKAAGVNKIISLSGGGLPYQKDKPKFADKLIRGIMKVVAKDMLNDAIAHAEVLKKSGLQWIIVRGPRLTTEPEKKQYRVGWVGVNASTKIGRADLADFILKQVERDEFVHEMPFVSY
jgi:putative NADH-flavin reductase